MCRHVPGTGQDPVFRFQKAGVWLPFTYHQLQNRLKQVIAAISFEPAAYSSHGFRRGGALFMVTSGVSRDVVKIVGNWRSDAIDQYIQMDLPTKVQAAKMVRHKICQECPNTS